MLSGNFTCLEIVFTFKRRLGYYLFHTYIPTCLIVIMSWISFWIRPEAVPARVTLGVTSLLTLTTQHANSQKSLPPVSYIKVRRIIIYFLKWVLLWKWVCNVKLLFSLNVFCYNFVTMQKYKYKNNTKNTRLYNWKKYFITL